MVRYRGSIEVFNLLSEVVTVASACQIPCSVPPVDVAESALVLCTYVSIAAVVIDEYVVPVPSDTLVVLMNPTDNDDPK
jgi:hypothetical protein